MTRTFTLPPYLKKINNEMMEIEKPWSTRTKPTIDMQLWSDGQTESARLNEYNRELLDIDQLYEEFRRNQKKENTMDILEWTEKPSKSWEKYVNNQEPSRSFLIDELHKRDQLIFSIIRHTYLYNKFMDENNNMSIDDLIKEFKTTTVINTPEAIKKINHLNKNY